MRPSRRWSAAAWTALGGCSVPACVDLFHSTSDVRTACEIDASACVAEASAAGTGAGQSVCADAGVALQNATHACAWLGACLSPMGNNAFGPCVLQALLAFDCDANPNHLASASVSATWACLVDAQSCASVDKCVFPAGTPSCSTTTTTTTTCAAGSGGGGTAGTALRIECGTSGQMLGGEDCALWGETCLPNDGSASCGTNLEGYCDGSVSDRCTGASKSQVIWCGADGQSGINCGDNGVGHCDSFSGNQTSWVSCLPDTNVAQPDACAATLNFTCENGVAQLCPTGVPETIDCAALLGSPAACSGSILDPPFDWTSPCVLSPQCDVDTCNGPVLTSCARGAPFSVNCADELSGQCQIVSTDVQTQHAACVPPSSP